MSRRAWIYISMVLLAAGGLSAIVMPGLALSEGQLLTFAALTVLASLAQLLEAEAPAHMSYYPTMIFLFAGVLLLNPPLFVLLVAIPHLLEWGRARILNSPRLRDWYLQPFNIATHIISGLAAYSVFNVLRAHATISGTVTTLLVATVAALTYLLLNHLIVGQAIVFARGISWRESGVIEFENLGSDFVMLCLGFMVATLWNLSPWMIVPALFPLLLIYRALSVPRLKKEAQTDDKTGLWNARHFTQLSTSELERAKRFKRPAALVLADLDLLRNINNTYGHLAGDTVLEGVGHIIRDHAREYDIAARFGGEEFCVLLPEAQLGDARAFAERLRKALEDTTFAVRTSNTPIHATMSLGVACFPEDASTVPDLIQQADTAMYQAKLRGRNCVVCASELPQFVRSRRLVAEDLSAPTYVGVAAETASEEAGVGGVTTDAERAPKPIERRELAPAERIGGNSPRPLLAAYLGAVIVLGAALTVVGSAMGATPDLLAIGLFTLLAVMAEVFEVNVYGPITVSASVAVNFAAALVTGLPGVACVSAAVALVHWVRMRPAPHHAAFNWATHVIAGAAPVLAIGVVGVPLEVANLLLLLIPAGVAALAYYAIETGLIAGAISLSSRTSLRVTWREQFRWLAEHYVVLCIVGLLMGVAYLALGVLGMVVFPLPVLMMHFAQKQYVERTQQSVRELRRMNEELTLANEEIVSTSEAMRQFHDELFLSFAKILEARDPFVSGHSAKVADYATAIAIELGLTADRVRELRQAAFLHDIGKVGVSETILRKPGRLAEVEQKQLESHAALGAEFLETCQGLRDLAPMVRHHHERWDGAGYPDGLAGEQIPLEARILAVCDAVDAMASDRPYREAMSVNEIVSEVMRCAGTQFDPAIAEAFARVAVRYGAELVVNSAHHAVRAPADNGEHLPQPLETGKAYLTL